MIDILNFYLYVGLLMKLIEIKKRDYAIDMYFLPSNNVWNINGRKSRSCLGTSKKYVESSTG
jgi:hypothetical protein